MEIARLKRLPHLEKAIREYEPQVDPVAQKKAELEVAMLELELEEIKAKTELAKAQAKKALAEAESTDLDMVEQGQGVDHQRKLQLAQAQAEGNQTYEVTKALVKPLKDNEKPGDVEAAIGFNELTKDSNKPAPTLPPAPPVDMVPMMPDQSFSGPPEPEMTYE
jgi:hypothetical protein